MTETKAMIGSRCVGNGRPAFLIAEAGFNHNGSVEIAMKLVDAAADAGADAIKFQSYTTREFLHTSVDYAHFFETARLNEAAHEALIAHARKRGILFGSTPLDIGWVATLHTLGADFLKIASMDVTTPSMLRAVGATGRPAILSTGLSTLDESASALGTLVAAGARDVILLHCLSLYPVPDDAVNLRAIRTMREACGRPIGFSDHTLGVDIPVLAVAAGACAIEKHFTLDKTMPGPDQSQSCDPREFMGLVRRIRAAEAALGTGEKRPHRDEEPLRPRTRRGLALARAVKAGEPVVSEMFRAVRPIPEPDGIPALEEEALAGATFARDMAEGEMVRRGDVAPR